MEQLTIQKSHQNTNLLDSKINLKKTNMLLKKVVFHNSSIQK